jgi:branched-chain amino acid aminotransferase
VKALCSIDGAVAPVAESTISITDEGFVRGDGAFEVLRLYDGKPFALDDHLNRLAHTANGIFLDWDRPAFEKEIDALLATNEDADQSLRLILTRGGRRIAMIEPKPTLEHGLKMQSVTYQPTIVLNGLKTLSYEANMTATRIAQSRGVDEALLTLPGGRVLEAPTSTIFWATDDGVIRTPKLDDRILASITRDRILKLLPVTEDDYELGDVLSASEVFLASSVREVQGVSELDGVSFDCPGPATQRIAGLLSERIQAELDETK